MNARWGMILVLAAFAMTPLHAEEGIEPEAPDAETPPAELRDPFWPVGYIPPDPVQVAVARVEVSVPWIELPVRGRSRAPDGTYRAFIPGVGIVKEGDIASIQRNGYWFHWRIVSIDARNVTPERIGITRERNPAALLAAQSNQDPENKDKEKEP